MDRIVIDRKSGKVIVNFETRLYPPEAIMESAQDYCESCWVYVDGNPDDKIAVTFAEKEQSSNLSMLGYEFYNHVLSVIQTQIR